MLSRNRLLLAVPVAFIGLIALSATKELTPPDPRVGNLPSESIARSTDEHQREEALVQPGTQAVRSAESQRTLAEALEGLGLEGTRLAAIRSKATEQGIGFDQESWLKPWGEVEDEIHAKYFVASDEDLTNWENLYAGKMFADGKITEAELSKFIWRRDYVIQEDELQKAQEIVDRSYPAIRAEARTVALEIAVAKQLIWDRGMYSKSPLVLIEDPNLDGEGKKAIGGVGGGGGGWCISYQIYVDDFPSLAASMAHLKGLKKSLQHELAIAFAKE